MFILQVFRFFLFFSKYTKILVQLQKQRVNLNI